jgi:MFS family permease
MALMAAATNGLFIFLTTIAERVGLNLAGLGLGMAAVSLFSAIGGVVGNRVGLRFGYTPPLIVGFLGQGTALFALANAHSQLAFWVSFTGVVTIYWFVFPYILGLGSRIDPHGRVSSVTGTAKIFAGAAGSALGGYFAVHSGIATYGAFAFASCAVAAALSVPVVRLVVRTASYPDKTGDPLMNLK